LSGKKVLATGAKLSLGPPVGEPFLAHPAKIIIPVKAKNMGLINEFIRSKVSKLSQAIAMLAQLSEAPSSRIKIEPQASIVAPVVMTSSTRRRFI